MTVSSFAFPEYAIQLKMKVRCSDLFDQIAWIVLAKFNCFRFVNDPRPLPGELPLSGASNLQQREASVKFQLKSGVVGRSNYAWYDVIGIRTLWKIAAGEELYLDYGSTYNIKLTIWLLVYCNNSNVRSFKLQVFIGKHFAFCTTPWYMTRKMKTNFFNHSTQWLNYSVDRERSAVQASTMHAVTSSHSFNEAILKVSSSRLKLGYWRMLKMSIDAYSE